MSEQPPKRKVLFDDTGEAGDAFTAVEQGTARVGEVLANARAARGVEVEDVATNLRIREEFLVAIEAGLYEELPGPTYALGFVRSYANYLGLDGEEAVRLFKGEREGAAGKAHLSFPEPVSESRIPRGAVLLISLILAITAYGGWYYMSSSDMELTDLVPKVPQDMGGAPVTATDKPAGKTADTVMVPAAEKAAIATPSTANPSPIVPAKPEAVAAPAAEKTPAPAPTALEKTPVPAPTPAAEAPTPQPAPAAVAVSPTPAPAIVVPTPAPTAAATGRATASTGAAIEIRAKADSWVQIRGPGGRVVVMRIFRSGDTFKVPDEKGLTLMTGNAGAIEITVDGKAVPAVGPVGAVRRNVALDAERLKAGTAVAR